MGMDHPPEPRQPTTAISSTTQPNLIRDHLANERTLLAWLRTAIAVAGLGFLIARFGVDLELFGDAGTTDDPSIFSELLGIALIAAAAALTALGGDRYRRTIRAIEDDIPPPIGRLDRAVTFGFSLVALLLVLAILLVD